MAESTLAQPIANVSDILNELLELAHSENAGFLDSSSASQFDPILTKLHEVLNTVPYTPIDTAGITDEKVILDIETYNTNTPTLFKETVISTAFQQVIELILSKHIELLTSSDDSSIIMFQNYEISSSQFRSFISLKTLLDFQIYSYENGLTFIKKSFFESFSLISKFLFAASTSQIDIFWYYIESRQNLISEKIFDQNIINDRISMLEICNNLNDKYHKRDAKGFLVPKDDFNDRFHYRVRIFISSILVFEDNTGLNKYFTVSKRKVPEFDKLNDNFLTDLLKVQKILNNPLFYLRRENSRELILLITKLLKVYDYLLLECERTTPEPQFLLPTPKSETEHQYLTDKYENFKYYPNNFWDTLSDTALSKDDSEYFLKLFSQQNIRYIFLFQIYILAQFYFELGVPQKRNFLKTVDTLNAKHITDEILTEHNITQVVALKRDLAARLRLTDPQFVYTILQLFNSEKIWWSWLIYGKDSKTKKPIFEDKALTDEEIKEIEETLNAFLPFKDKQYFNTYITPQLTRKMKVERGIEKLKVGKPDLNKFDSQFDEIKTKLNLSNSTELIEERNTILWKKLKGMRQASWFDLSENFSKEIINADDLRTNLPNQEPTPGEENELELGGDTIMTEEPNQEQKQEQADASSLPVEDIEMEEASTKRKIEDESTKQDIEREEFKNVETREEKEEEQNLNLSVQIGDVLEETKEESAETKKEKGVEGAELKETTDEVSEDVPVEESKLGGRPRRGVKRTTEEEEAEPRAKRTRNG